MSPLAITAVIFALMLVLMALRTPIAVAMFVAGSVGYVAQAGWLPFANFLNAQAFARFASYDLSVIPLFILMGNFASQGGISKALFRVRERRDGALSRRPRRWRRCSPRARSGRSAARRSRPRRRSRRSRCPRCAGHGYSGRLATGTLAAGGTLGILIPPSVPLVIYAILAEQNIAKLFAAAMVPGVIAMVGYMIAIAIYVRVVPGQAPTGDEVRAKLTLKLIGGIAPIAIIFLIVFGGIYGGKFTPTEGAAGRRRRDLRRRAAEARDHLAEVQALLLRDRRGVGDDLSDLHRRRSDELGARADPGAGPARERRQVVGACRR
jgi:hypothetical protein